MPKNLQKPQHFWAQRKGDFVNGREDFETTRNFKKQP